MNSIRLLSSATLGPVKLTNRIVMAPMTRARALNNIPNILMASFYRQRAAAGLIITEGTSPSPNGLGYSRIPGIFSREQMKGWKKVTKAVHAANGKIILQLMHTGRISHSANMPPGSVILAPSAIPPAGQIMTDSLGKQKYPIPIAMSYEEIQHTKQEFMDGAVNAIQSNFDGIEIHAADGYLIEQFLSPASNTRIDQYGGTVENRCRFLLEVIEGVIAVVGKQGVGIRLSPYGTMNDMPHYPEIDETYACLAEKLDRLKILYIDIVDHARTGTPDVPVSLKQALRDRFHGTIILSGGYTKETAEAELQGGIADLIAFGRPFINNPDLVARFRYGWPVSELLDKSTFYSPGEKGYTDYPLHQQ
ncbi:MAG: alkene reductase [Bacteroidota bacterium]